MDAPIPPPTLEPPKELEEPALDLSAGWNNSQMS